MLSKDEVRIAWLRRLRNTQGKLPFVGVTFIPLVLIPLIALTHNTIDSIIQASIACATFGGFSLFVEVTWILWRRSRGKQHSKIEKDLIPLAILHLCLFFSYFMFVFMWAILGIAGTIGVPKTPVLVGGVIGFAITTVYTFIRGSYYNRLLFPAMYFDVSVISKDPYRRWRRFEAFAPLVLAIGIFFGSVFGRSGTLQYAYFLMLAGYAVATMMLFFSMLVLYQLAVLLFVNSRHSDSP